MELLERVKEIMTDVAHKRKWDENLRGHGGTGGHNVVTGCINDSGESIVKSYPCHRPINSFVNAKTLWSLFGYRTSPEIGRFYFDWLVNRSPWSKTGIIPKLDKEFMYETGFVFTDLDKVPANLLHNFLIASRLAAEWPVFITDWYHLVREYNIDESLAFFMVTVFADSENNISGYKSLLGSSNITYASDNKYDWPLDTYSADDDYIKNFVSGNPVRLSDKMFYPNAMTAPVNILWGTTKTGSYLKSLRKVYPATDKRVIKGAYGNASFDCLSLNAVLNIMRQEEIRLGLKDERKAA